MVHFLDYIHIIVTSTVFERMTQSIKLYTVAVSDCTKIVDTKFESIPGLLSWYCNCMRTRIALELAI